MNSFEPPSATDPLSCLCLWLLKAYQKSPAKEGMREKRQREKEGWGDGGRGFAYEEDSEPLTCRLQRLTAQTAAHVC